MDVRTPSAQVAAMAEHWPMIDALMGGTSAMRKAGKRFLPQWPAEEVSSYAARLATTTLFPAYARTVSVLVGKPFSEPLTIGDDVPPALSDLLDDVDLEGRNLHTFAADLAADALAYGLCGILVDAPLAEGVRTRADEQRAGIRPYFVHIRGPNILGWRSERQGNKQMLTQLRLLEAVEEADGAFGVSLIEQVRVLEPGRWSTWRKQPAANGQISWTLYDEGISTLPIVPFVPVYGRRVSFMVGEPPMLELAHLNVEHWQSKSDQQTILHIARVPILFARGLGEQQIVIGANAYVTCGSETAELKYVEHSGAAIEAGRVSLLDLQEQMRQVGAELLVNKPGNRTVAQDTADSEQGRCDLQRIGQGIENGLDQALDLMAQWIGEPTGGHVDVYDDYGVDTLHEASEELLFRMQQAGALSHETLLDEMKRRGTIKPELDIQAEIATATAQAAERIKAQAGIQRTEQIRV